ncbi:MAG: DUF4058 family protein [Bacteroidetes bacterium]|nr:MAG: DUF4058 family protein [Bacteroidota bacterium]
MKSPFPGMDPYLEGYLWPDVHNRLAAVISELLTPRIAPKYVARIELYTVTDNAPESEIGIMYPDVEVLMRKVETKEPEVTYPKNAAVTAPTVVIPGELSIPVRIPVVEIRDAAKNKLITAIEILSPVNKKPPGLERYREKRLELHRAGVHLLEIDLLRRGTRPFKHPQLPQAHYIMTLLRAATAQTEVWAVNLKEPLPVLPVPLLSPDPDVPLDLRQALDLIYERSKYELSIDYKKEPPPPAFSAEERAWMQGLKNG